MGKTVDTTPVFCVGCRRNTSRRELAVGLSSLFILLLSNVGLAQRTNDPGFDPAPLEIANIAKMPPRAITSMDLLKIRDIQGLSISPDGKYIAFVVAQAVYESNSYKSALYIVATQPGGRPVLLGTAGPPRWDDVGTWDNEPPQWSPDSRYITYLMEADGTWQVWRWNREGGPSQLTHFQRSVESYRWSTDGHELVATIKKTDDAIERRRLSERGILYDGTLTAWNRIPLIDQIMSRASVKEVWIHDLETGEERKATTAESKSERWVSDLQEQVLQPGNSLAGHHIVNPIISPDGRTVVYKYFFNEPSDFSKDTFVLFSKPVRGGTPIRLSAGAPYVGQFWWKPDSTGIYYTENDGDGHPSRLLYADVKGGTPKKVFDGPQWLQDYSADGRGRYVACTLQTNTSPPQIALLDLTTGTVRALADPNPEFKDFILSPAVRIEGTNKYGDRWFAHLVKPLHYQQGTRYPLVITTYRSGDSRFLRGGTGDEYPIQVLAANGFAVLSFDTGVDRSFKRGDFEAALMQWVSPVASMEMAVKSLVTDGVVDPKKVALTGLSHGAEMVEFAISHTSFVSAAIDSGGGARDPYFYYIAGKVWQGLFSAWGIGGWPEGNSRKNWQKLSPQLNAGYINAPLLVNAADSEFIADLPLVTSLEQLGKPVELVVYPDEMHVKKQPKHRLEIYQRNLEWLRFWLLGHENPDPAKSEQYKRWRELSKRENEGNGKHTNSSQTE